MLITKQDFHRVCLHLKKDRKSENRKGGIAVDSNRISKILEEMEEGEVQVDKRAMNTVLCMVSHTFSRCVCCICSSKAPEGILGGQRRYQVVYAGEIVLEESGRPAGGVSIRTWVPSCHSGQGSSH